jgi:hypothetical protein
VLIYKYIYSAFDDYIKQNEIVENFNDGDTFSVQSKYLKIPLLKTIIY